MKMTSSAMVGATTPLFNAADFPLVRYQAGVRMAGYSARWIAELEQFLTREEPFVLITNGMQEEEAPEDRKRRTLWFKQNRERLGRYCKGMILVRESPSLRERLMVRAATAGKAFPFPVAIVATEDAAVALAKRLLGDSRIEVTPGRSASQ
jgi:hypothetical protein